MSDVKGTLNKIKTGSVQNRLAAIGALFSLASDPEAVEEIRNAGGIANLVGCLDDKTDFRIPRQALGALLNLANDDQCREDIREYSGVEAILKLLDGQKDEVTLEYGTGALLNLASDEETRELVTANDGAKILAQCVKSTNSEVKKNTIGAIAQICFDPQFTQDIVKEGALPFIISGLESDDPECRNRTSGAIWNLSVGSDETREALSNEGALEKLVTILQSSDEDVETLANSVMCISILSSNDTVSDTLRNIDGAFPLIVKLLSHEDGQICENAAAAVWNLSHNEENRNLLATLDTMPSLVPLLEAFQNNYEALEKVLGAVLTSCASDDFANQFRENGGFQPLQAIISGKVDQRNIENEQHKKCVLYAIIGFAILAYNDKNKDEIRECGALGELLELLRVDYDDELLEKDTAAILNLTHNIENRVAIRKLDGIAALIELLYHPNENIQMNAAGALWNLSNDDVNKTVIRKLGGLKPLLTLIGGGKVEPKSKKDRAISKKDLEEATRAAEEEAGGNEQQEEQPPVPVEPLEPKITLDEIEQLENPNKLYNTLDEDIPVTNDLFDYSKPQLNVDDEERTSSGGGEYGDETDLPYGKIIVAAKRIDIKRRRKQLEREIEQKEQEERERRRKEREEREKERQRKEEEERKKKEEEEKKRQKIEEEKKKKVEEEMKKKAEEERERERKRAELEQTKNKEQDAFDVTKKRRGAVQDDEVDWDEIYPEGFDESKDQNEAKDKLQSQINDYRELISPFNDSGIRDHLNDEELKLIQEELEDAEKFLKNKPNATPQEIDKRRKDLDKELHPIVSNKKERKAITDLTSALRDRLVNDPELIKNLTPEERKELEQALDELERWLEANPNATKEEIEAKERELMSKIKPILARANNRQELENYSHNLRKKISDDEDMLFDLLGDEDKGTLHDTLKDIDDFLSEHPNATATELEEKLEEAKKRIDPVLEKAKKKKELLDYASNMRDRINNDEALRARLTPEERKAIETALDDFDRFIKNNPNIDVENIQKQKTRLKQKIDPYISRGDAHNALDEYNHRIRKRIEDNDDLGDLIDEVEKRQILKEIKDSEDFLKKVEKDPSKFTAEDINNKKKELKEKLVPVLEKAEKRKGVLDTTKEIRERINDNNDLGKYISPKDKKALELAINEIEDWVLKNKKATPKQIEEREKQFVNKTKDIIDGAEQRKQLNDYAGKLRERLNDNDFVSKLKPEEKKAIETAINEVVDFIQKNPEATPKKVEEQRNKLNEKVRPILERVREIDALKDLVSNVRDKVKDDPELSKFLSPKEKQLIEKSIDEIEKLLKNKPTIEQTRKAEDDFNEKVRPIIQNAKARSELSNYGERVANDVEEDPYTTPKDKELVKKAKKEHIDDFLTKNPEANEEQIMKQKEKFNQAVASVTDRINKKKQLESKVNDLIRKLDDKDSSLCKNTTPEERQYLATKVEEFNKFLEQNPNATTKELQQKLEEFESHIAPIIKTAEKRSNLEQKANELRDRIVNLDDDLGKYLNDKEKKQIKDATQEALDFLEKNPNCSLTEVVNAQQKLDEKTKGLVEKASAKGGLYRKAKDLLLDLNKFGEGGLGGMLSNTERDEVMDLANETIAYLDKNQNITAKDIKQKEKELNKNVKPIVDKVKERKKLRDLVHDIREQVFDNFSLDVTTKDASHETKSLDEEFDNILDVIVGKKQKKDDATNDFSKRRHAKFDSFEQDESKLGDFLNDEEKKKIDFTTQEVLDFIDNNPSLTAPEIKEKTRNLKKDTASILEAAKSRSGLRDYAKGIRDQIRDERSIVYDNLNDNDKKLIDNAVNEILDWIDREGKNASLDAVEKKKKELANKVEPILQKAREKGELQNMAQNLRQRMEEDVELTSLLNDNERKLIDSEIQEVIDWLDNNPNATLEEITKKKKQFQDKVEPIIEKAESRNKLKNFANELRGRINDNDDLGGKLNDKEKKAIEASIDEAIDFLDTNPNASKNKIEEKRHILESKVFPIINKAEKARDAEQYANEIKDKLQNDTKLIQSLTPEEKKAIEDSTQDLLDWIDNNVTTANKNQIKDKERECREKVDPIINKAKARQNLKDEIQKLKEKIQQDSDVSGLALTEEEKKQVENAINESLDFLDTVANKPTTSVEQIKDKLNDLKNKVNPVVEKARARKDLEKYATTVRDKVNNDDQLAQRLTATEKKTIDNAAKDALDFINARGSNASLFEIKEKKRETKEKVEPSLLRAEKHRDLENFATNIRNRANNELKDKLSPEEKKLVDQETQKTLDWLTKNKNAPLKEVESQQRQLEQKISPIIDRAQAKKDLETFATNVRDKLKNDKELASTLSNEEKKTIDEKVQSTLDWLKKNPNATLNDIALKRKQLENVVNNIFDDKEAAQNLKNYADRVLEVLAKNKQVQKNLTEEEKRAIQDFAEEARDFLAENPNATYRQIRLEKKKLEDRLAKIKMWKFEVPVSSYLGFGFQESLRWGDQSKRTTEFYYGSYLKQAERKTAGQNGNKPTTGANKQPTTTPVNTAPKLKITPKPKQISKEEEEELKMFDTMKFKKGGLIQAKLQSLMNSVGSAGAVSGSVLEDVETGPSAYYSYEELKNNKQKKYPAGVDANKREQYLSDSDFMKIFKMSKGEFNRLPEFKQTKMKRDVELFAFAYED
ncbi:hypothetical protein ABK040_000242 [Willaertia magna]